MTTAERAAARIRAANIWFISIAAVSGLLTILTMWPVFIGMFLISTGTVAGLLGAHAAIMTEMNDV